MRWYNFFLATFLIGLAACSSTKQLQTQTTAASNTRSSGHLEDVIQFINMDESWVIPTERNGVVVYDTIRHRIDLNDTVRHRVKVNDTIHSQVLQEQTKGKVKQNQTGLRESILSVGRASRGSSVALVISIGINSILILVILSIYFLNKYHKE